jgi:TRAP-type uncharacterized transport system substrate-binding protein
MVLNLCDDRPGAVLGEPELMRFLSSLAFGLCCCLPTVPSLAQSALDPLILAQANTPTAAAEGELDNASRVNSWTVGVAGGLLEGTFIRFAAELGKALDDGDNLRILPLVSYGAAENVSDLLYLKGIDIAITDADVFEEYKKNQKYRNIDKRINYISEMYVAEFHVYARPEIKTLKDLEGKKVGFNTKGSAANITGKIVFERLGINVEPVFVNNSIGIEKMKSGEFAAIVHAVGKPNDLFKKETGESGFHFIPVEYTDVFADYYLPSTLQSEDYPSLLKPGEVIKTIGVPVVLAVYNWPKGSDRFRRVERFIQYYFSRFETLRKPPYHPKWREINLAAKIPGWTRYWVAEDLLAKGVGTALANQPEGAVETSSSVVLAPGDQQLFKEFMAWKQKQGR